MAWYYGGMLLVATGNLYFAWRSYRMLKYHLRRIDHSAREARAAVEEGDKHGGT